jgi:hypothetical protein
MVYESWSARDRRCYCFKLCETMCLCLLWEFSDDYAAWCFGLEIISRLNFNLFLTDFVGFEHLNITKYVKIKRIFNSSNAVKY